MMTLNHRNHNMIVKRNFKSSSGYMPPRPDRDPNDFTIATIGIIIGCY